MSDHLKRGSERDMGDGEVMEKFYHNVDYGEFGRQTLENQKGL
jgi:hypothetical protein